MFKHTLYHKPHPQILSEFLPPLTWETQFVLPPHCFVIRKMLTQGHSLLYEILPILFVCLFSLEAALIQFWMAQDWIFWGWGKAGGSRLLLFIEKRLCLPLVAAVIYYEVCRQECMVEVTLIRTLKAQTRKKTDRGFKWNPPISHEAQRIQMKPYEPSAAVCAPHTPSFLIKMMTTVTAAPLRTAGG